MAINTIKATIQMRRGLEQDFDADKMTAGEWAVSTDKKYVRMCFAPGLCLRMATYEAFEADMVQIQTILATCQDIQAAVDAMVDLAEQHKNAAAASASESDSYSKLSKSYAVGTDGEVREDDNVDNAKYYYEQAKRAAQSANGIIPMGTITFDDLANQDNQQTGYMFNISNSFVSDERFADGGGIFYGAGSNLIFTAEGKWDVMAASMVSGVKGEAETEYRQGFVNISAANMGIGSATSEKAGLVKPDGETTTVDENGVIHAIGSQGTVDYNDLQNKPSINSVQLSGDKSLEALGITPIVPVTESEYEALPEDKLTDGKLYLVDDGGGAEEEGYTEAAENVYFDNAQTQIPFQNVQFALTWLASFHNPTMHRNIYRGKALGASYTDAQKQAIADGTFDDLYLGDYWTKDGRIWRVSDMNYWLNTGDTPCTVNHALIVPDKKLYDAKMNDTDTTAGGYANSKMRTTYLEQAKTIINEMFGADNILSHRELFTSAVSSGTPSSWYWYDSQVEIMNEHMVYGSHAWGGGSQNGYDTGFDKSQLALFQARPDLITSRENWRLRDVRSATDFCCVIYHGNADACGASTSIGVRPVFGITG